MTKKTRLIILLACVACFFVVAPILVMYSMGYRFDFQKMEITATGGIYLRTYPVAGQFIIDSKIKGKPGMFSNSIFVQSLLPSNHSVLITKSGYYDYSKILPVAENQVTKLENVLLIKKNIQFKPLVVASPSPFNIQEKFIIKNYNLYYSNSPENSGVTAAQKLIPVVKKVAAFAMQNNNIIWLGTDGFVYKTDLTAAAASNAVKITLAAMKFSKTGSYKIILDNSNIFLISSGELLFLNPATKTLDTFYASVRNAVISPDGKNVIYYNDNNIYLSPISTAPVKTNTLYKSTEKISNCLWLNNDYIIFTAGGKIIISEIDFRGNINAVTLPQTADKIFFNHQDGKLYILTADTLLSSEKITQ